MLIAWIGVLLLLLIRWNLISPAFQGRLVFPTLGLLRAATRQSPLALWQTQYVKAAIERARAAWAAGLEGLYVGDHHATPVPYYQNSPILGRLAAECLAIAPAHLGNRRRLAGGRTMYNPGAGRQPPPPHPT